MGYTSFEGGRYCENKVSGVPRNKSGGKFAVSYTGYDFDPHRILE